MNQANNRIAKNTALLFAKSGIVLVVSLYASRVLLKKLGIEDYGVYHVVGSVVLMFMSLRVFFSNAIQRFLNYTRGTGDEIRLQQVFSTGVLVQLLMAAIFVFFLETVGLYALLHLNLTVEQMNVAKVIFQIAIATAVISMLTVPYDALLLSHERMDVYSVLAVAERLLTLGIIFLIDAGPFDHLINYSLMLFLASLLIRSLNALYCRRHFSECRMTWRPNRPLIKEMGVFAGWNFLGWTGYSVLHESVNYLFNLSGGVVVNAARSIAYQMMKGCSMLSGNVSTAFRPQTNAAAASSDRRDFHRLLCRNAQASFACYLMVTLPLLALARPLVQFWLGQVPEYVIPFALAMGGYSSLRSLHALVDVYFLSLGDPKYYQMIEMVSLLMNIPVAWLLLQQGLPYWTVLASLSFFEAISHIASVVLAVKRHGFPWKYFWRSVYFPFLLSGILATLILYLSLGPGPTDRFLPLPITGARPP